MMQDTSNACHHHLFFLPFFSKDLYGHGLSNAPPVATWLQEYRSFSACKYSDFALGISSSSNRIYVHADHAPRAVSLDVAR